MALAPLENNVFLGVDRSVLGRRWELRPVDEMEVAALVGDARTSDAVARVLVARGIKALDADIFLQPTLKALMPDPSTLMDMDRAAARLVAALQSGERITVFGDYDVDGATSSALFKRFFRSVGVEVGVYIPDRRTEGYGPNAPALLGLKAEGAQVVITVDCGIVAFESLKVAQDAGLDVVVVDHHKAEVKMPAAAAIVNPNRLDDSSGQGHLAAVGVAFLLVVAVNRVLRETGWYAEKGIAEPDLRQWLDLVALGTVCDVVPLKNLNRAFVAQGLKVLKRGGSAGLKALSRVAKVDSHITAFHLGYLLGPRVNAGGRVGQADTGARLLATDDVDEAAALAMKLDEFNASRKEIEAAVLCDALEQAEINKDSGDPLLVVSGKDWHPGVIGIVAGRLKERCGLPVCVIALDGGMAKGSGRSVAGVDLGRAVSLARDAGHLFSGGGHAMAAGFTVEEQRLPAFTVFMQNEVRRQLQGESFVAQLNLDGALAASAITVDLITELDCVAPFGAGNDEPRFAVVDVKVGKANVVGTGHVRCFLSGRGGGYVKAIAFNSADSELGRALLTAASRRMHIAGTVRVDNWQGRRSVQLIIDDAAFAQ